MKIKITKWDVIWNYLGVFMTLGVNLLILPLVLQRLSSKELGIWYAFLAAGSFAALFDFGFKATMTRNITYAWCGADRLSKSGIQDITAGIGSNFQLLAKVVAAAKKIYFIISLMAFVLCLTIGTAYIISVSKELDRISVFIPWIIYTVGVFVNLYGGYLGALLAGTGAIAQSNISNIAARTAQLFVSILLLLSGFGLYAMALAYVFYGIVYRIVSIYLLGKHEKKLAEVRTRKKCRSVDGGIKDVFFAIWHNAWRDGIVSLSQFLCNQAMTLLSASFLSLEETGIYGLSLQLVAAIVSISSALFSAFIPQIQEYYVRGEKKQLKEMFSVAVTFFVLAYISGSAMLIVLGLPILKFIKPDIAIRIPLLIGLQIYYLIHQNQSLFASFIAGTNRIPYMAAYGISSGAAVVGTALLLNYSKAGIWALVLFPLLCDVAYNAWRWPLFVFRELEFGLYEMFRLGVVGIYHRIRNLFIGVRI